MSPPKPPAARVEATLDMWAEGKTARAIAIALADGTTRNAVIGMVHRARTRGDARAQQRYASPSTPRYKLPPKPKAQRRKLYKLKVPKMNTIRDYAPPIDWHEPEGIMFSEANPGQCMFFVRGTSRLDGKVCGCPAILGKAWCPSHYRRVYVAQRVMEAA